MSQVPAKDRKEYDKQYREANSERLKQYQKTYYKNNKESMLVRLDTEPDMHQFTLVQIYLFNLNSLVKLNPNLKEETNIPLLQDFKTMIEFHLADQLRMCEARPNTRTKLPLAYHYKLIEYLTNLISYLSKQSLL